MNTSKIYNLTHNLNKIFLKNSNKNIMGYKENKIWKWHTKLDMYNKIYNCYMVLQECNIKLNDRIMYQGNNSVEWFAWNVATNAIGGIWVPLYSNQSDLYAEHIINDCQPKLFIKNIDENDKLYFRKYKVNFLSNNIPELHYYNSELPFNEKSEIANLIYTSGTTGKPKGVTLTHKNIISNVESIMKRFNDFENKNLTTLNILPWAHIYGMTSELYYNILNSNKIAISGGPEKFINEISEIQPDILYVVPRILNLVKSKVEFLDKPIINLILPKILKKIFGKNLITIFVGGSALENNIREFYSKYNINVCQGYGCTETSPMISVNHIETPRNEKSIGKIMDGTIVKIINEEILVHSDSVMKGYWNNDKANKEVFKIIDNKKFYKTGDSGFLENDFLFYTGRISDNYKLNNGKFVNLKDIETIINKFINCNYIVFGENFSYNIIITEDENIISQNTIDKINLKLDSYLKIKYVMKIPNNTFENFYTPKLSLKRKLLIKHIYKDIEEFYKIN